MLVLLRSTLQLCNRFPRLYKSKITHLKETLLVFVRKLEQLGCLLSFKHVHDSSFPHPKQGASKLTLAVLYTDHLIGFLHADFIIRIVDVHYMIQLGLILEENLVATLPSFWCRVKESFIFEIDQDLLSFIWSYWHSSFLPPN